MATLAKIDVLFTLPCDSVRQLNSDGAKSLESGVEVEMGLPQEDLGRNVPRSVQPLRVKLESRREQQPPTTTTSVSEGTNQQVRYYERFNQSGKGLGVGCLSSQKSKTTKTKKIKSHSVIDELFSRIEEGSR